MALDDQDELRPGVSKKWYLCSTCGDSLVIDEETGEAEYQEGEIDPDLPF